MAARQVPLVQGVHQVEYVVTGTVGHRPGDVLHLHPPGFQEQRELADLLVGRQQIALHPIRDQLRDAGPGLKPGLAHSRGDPARQSGPLRRPYLHDSSGFVERLDPRRLHRALVQPWNQHEQQHIFRGRRSKTDQRFRAGGAGLAVRYAQFDESLLGKQRHGASGGGEFAPVEVSVRGQNFALAEALAAGSRPYHVAGLRHEQGLVSRDQVDRGEIAGEVRLKFMGGDGHVPLSDSQS